MGYFAIRVYSSAVLDDIVVAAVVDVVVVDVAGDAGVDEEDWKMR